MPENLLNDPLWLEEEDPDDTGQRVPRAIRVLNEASRTDPDDYSGRSWPWRLSVGSVGHLRRLAEECGTSVGSLARLLQEEGRDVASGNIPDGPLSHAMEEPAARLRAALAGLGEKETQALVGNTRFWMEDRTVNTMDEASGAPPWSRGYWQEISAKTGAAPIKGRTATSIDCLYTCCQCLLDLIDVPGGSLNVTSLAWAAFRFPSKLRGPGTYGVIGSRQDEWDWEWPTKRARRRQLFAVLRALCRSDALRGNLGWNLSGTPFWDAAFSAEAEGGHLLRKASAWLEVQAKRGTASKVGEWGLVADFVEKELQRPNTGAVCAANDLVLKGKSLARGAYRIEAVRDGRPLGTASFEFQREVPGKGHKGKKNLSTVVVAMCFHADTKGVSVGRLLMEAYGYGGGPGGPGWEDHRKNLCGVADYIRKKLRDGGIPEAVFPKLYGRGLGPDDKIRFKARKLMDQDREQLHVKKQRGMMTLSDKIADDVSQESSSGHGNGDEDTWSIEDEDGPGL